MDLEKRIQTLETKYKALVQLSDGLATALSASNRLTPYIYWGWSKRIFKALTCKRMQQEIERVYLEQQKAYAAFVNDLAELEDIK